MSYSFSNGFRLVLPYIDRIKYRMKGGWVGKDAEEVTWTCVTLPNL